MSKEQILRFIQDKRQLLSFILLFLIAAGWYSYQVVPKENAPSITIPIVLVRSTPDNGGYGKQDMYDKVVVPFEQMFINLDGLKDIQTFASDNYSIAILKFHSEVDMKTALDDVRRSVNEIKLPSDVSTSIKKIKADSTPVLNLIISGNIPDMTLASISHHIQKFMQLHHAVFDVKILGVSSPHMEVLLDPAILHSRNVQASEVLSALSWNDFSTNLGTSYGDGGNFTLNIPGKFQKEADLEKIIIRAGKDRESALTLMDIVKSIKYKLDTDTVSEQSFSNGKHSVTIKVYKKDGFNVINIGKQLTAMLKLYEVPEGTDIQVTFNLGEAVDEQVSSLLNLLSTSTIAVFCVALLFLHIRSTLLISAIIPLTFLSVFLALVVSGATLNSMVVFGMMISAGLLVDMVIVIVELAEKNMSSGMNASDAFLKSTSRMMGAIIASTLTTVIVFIPLLKWPGVVGKFMVYLPISISFVLISSVIITLVFLPAMGSHFLKKVKTTPSPKYFRALTLKYLRCINWLLSRRARTIGGAAVAICMAVAGPILFLVFGNGIVFFPQVTPDYIQLTIYDQDTDTMQDRLNKIKAIETGLHHMYPQSISRIDSYVQKKESRDSDQIAEMNLSLADWKTRSASYKDIKNEVLSVMETISDTKGINFDISEPASHGPPQKSDIEFSLLGKKVEDVNKASNEVVAFLKAQHGISMAMRPRSDEKEIIWDIVLDKRAIGLLGTNASAVGRELRLSSSSGVKISDYIPDPRIAVTDESTPIIMRLPSSERNFQSIMDSSIGTIYGSVSLDTVSNLQPIMVKSSIERRNLLYSSDVVAGVNKGVKAASFVQPIRNFIAKNTDGIQVYFRGSLSDMQENKAFLTLSFFTAILMISLVLLGMFKYVSRVFVMLTAIVLSTGGVFWGLLFTAQPFSVIMTGLGVIALSGIVVNNNIVLIDTYIEMEQKYKHAKRAIVATVQRRFRPIILTTLTTFFSSLIGALQLDMDWMNHAIHYSSPGIQVTMSLSIAVCSGTMIGSVLTLFMTPCMLQIVSMLRPSLRKKAVTSSESIASIAPQTSVGI